MNSPATILEADGIWLQFGGRKILQSVYIKLQRGHITGLLGRNGCGKSCLLKSVLGLMPTETQSIRVDGRYVEKPYQQPKLIRYLPQHPFLPSELTIQAAFEWYGVKIELFTQWDSKGQQLVQNGNGTARFQLKHDDKWVTETGAIKNGRKEGVWYGRSENGSVAYRETYQQGNCLSGTAFYGTDSVAYQQPEQHPEFKGGLPGLGGYLSSTLRYPPEAIKANIAGKVFVSFVVCEDGSLCDYEIIRSVHPAVDREALRVVKASNGKWKPGAVRGRKVRVKYNLPVNFQLQ